MRQAVGKRQILGEQLRQVVDHYDICRIDCAPWLGLLMINASVGAPDTGRSVFAFAATSKATQEYRAPADEIPARLRTDELAVAG